MNSRWRTGHLRTSVGILLVVLCCLIEAAPAHAGYYWIAPESQEGSVTVTPAGGTPTTYSLEPVRNFLIRGLCPNRASPCV